jgi:hypothetical protein
MPATYCLYPHHVLVDPSNDYNCSAKLSVATEWLVLLLRIGEVQGSDLGPDNGY